MSKIKLIVVKSDLGGRKPGASLGIDAIRMASYKTAKNFEYFRRFDGNNYEKIEANNLLFNYPNKYPDCKKIEELIVIFEKISDTVSKTLENNSFPIIIAGDHSTAGGTISGIKQAFPHKKLGVIWIDAHADVHTPYTSDSGNMHGMPLGTVIDDNNIECQFKELDAETAKLWERIKNVGGMKKKISLSDLVYIGLRSYEIAEDSLIKKYKTKVIRTIDLRIFGAKEAAHQAMQHLDHCDIIYVSFDVDSMDPAVSVGTGTPVEGGLFSSEAEELLKTLASFEKVKCIEISEVNPILDTNNKMAEVAFNILKSICKNIDIREE